MLPPINRLLTIEQKFEVAATKERLKNVDGQEILPLYLFLLEEYLLLKNVNVQLVGHILKLPLL
jgi:hypothetical protein